MRNIEKRLTRPCTISRRVDASERDAYNRPKKGAAAEVETTGYLEQLSAEEMAELGEITDSRWRLTLASNEELSASDAVTVDDVAYEVDGTPERVWDPRRQRTSHIEARLRRTGRDGS